MNDYSQIPVDEVLQQTASSKRGLTPAEAKKRLKKQGKNVLFAAHKTQVWRIYAKETTNRFAIILLIGSLVAYYLDRSATVIGFLTAAALVIVPGFIQAQRTGRFHASLQHLLTTEATVIRSGRRIRIDSRELVRGDIVYLERGHAVPADLRVIDSERLSVNEFTVTGNATPKRKQPELIRAAEYPANIALMGSEVVSGSGRGLVVETGSRTVIAGIVRSHKAVEVVAPLQRQLNNWARRATQAGSLLLALAAITVLLGHRHSGDFWQFVILICAAVVPTALALEAMLFRSGAKTINGNLAFSSALSGLATKVTVALLSVIVYLLFNIPLAAAALLLLALDIIVQSPLRTVLSHIPASGVRRLPGTGKAIGFGALAAGLAYLNFLLFFGRQGISPVHLSSEHILYAQAATLTWISLAVCQLINLVFVGFQDGRLPAANTKKLLLAFGTTTVGILAVTYSPMMQYFFGTAAISLGDWLCIGALMAIYAIARSLIQLHRPHAHSRQAVIDLHLALPHKISKL